MHNKYINSMRMISLLAIKNAKQGHAGMSMSCAPILYTLYTNHMHISKKDPKWINRDRFILSAGHGSVALYSILHFAGLISLDDIKNFKKDTRLTPGHPEYLKDNYIDVSTGPLGQGVAMGVGSAIAQKYLENKFKNISDLIDHYTYVVVGDGDIQEGISYEAMSLAGKLKLNKLIILHDANFYQLDSSVNKVFDEDLHLRAKSMDWNYIEVKSDDFDSINNAINQAKVSDKPTYIKINTTIGYATKLANNNKSHSMNLVDEDIAYSQSILNTNNNGFEFDKQIYDYFESNVLDRNNKYQNWLNKIEEYKIKYPQEINKFLKFINQDFDITSVLKKIKFEKLNVPTRNYVKDLMTLLKENNVDYILAGCADLEAATNIKISDTDFNDNLDSNNIKYGIREFAMSAITNGILAHGVLKTISGTFLVFSDYMKSSIRLGALMELPNFYIFTHDCYQVGGDGPTHQPIEQLAMLRSIPNVNVFKPCDHKEFIASVYCALNSKKETNVLVLTRHGLDSNHKSSINDVINYGGYIIDDSIDADITLAGSGTEIDLLFETKAKLESLNIKTKIVSICNLKKFVNNKKDYIEKTLASKYGLLTVESSSDSYWYRLTKFVNNHIHFEANEFGKSMDGNLLYKQKGFNSENLLNLIKQNLIK